MSRTGFKPNKNEQTTLLFLFLPNNSVAGYHIAETMKNYSPDGFQVGNMVHRPKKDATWQYEFGGHMAVVDDPEDFNRAQENPQLITDFLEVTLDLSFSPISEIYEYSKHMTEESLEVGKKAGDEHFEQIAMIDGEIRLGEKKYQIRDTLGQRDHTHGVRDWIGIGNWRYYVVWFNERLAVNPAAITTLDGRFSSGGFLFQDGNNIPLQSVRMVEEQFREDGVIPISSELELIDANGNTHILKARAGPAVPILFDENKTSQAFVILAFGEFELDGIEGGYGSFECLRKVVKSRD